ncbi:MAG: RidA family protein [Chloroflexi bacterium]|nr:RidA family protein [Chloroflexota bacterium]
MSASPQYRKEVLLEDERGRGFAAVVRLGPYLFVAGSDGNRDLATERIDPELAGKASEQCRNSYGRIDDRLRKCGYGGDHVVWIENFTRSQEWHSARMALWPEYFGEQEHGLAVSWGVESRMNGINMITTVAMALTPEIARTAVVPQPSPGRASRVTLAPPFVFVIGVRGRDRGEPEECREAFEAQLRSCFDRLSAHVSAPGGSLSDFVRVDAAVRDLNQLPEYRKVVSDVMGGAVPFTSHVIGVPLGARGEQEIGGVAVAPGVPKEIAWTGDRVESVRAGGLVFASGCPGLRGQDLRGDKPGQARQALLRLEGALSRFGVGLENLARLDVFLRDIYFEEGFLEVCRPLFGAGGPAITFVGADLEGGAEVGLSAIAAA